MSDEAITRTQVGIVGAGPAGLLLAHMLELHGIGSVVLEARDRSHVEGRVRAGVLERATRDLLVEIGAGERLQREGLIHTGVELRFRGRGHRIALDGAVGDGGITIYGQQELVKDLIAGRVDAGLPLLFEVADVTIDGLLSDRPTLSFRHDGVPRKLHCDVVAGCDGFHGISRVSLPAGALTEHSRVFPFAWLGILARVAPSSKELVYCRHERGFALHSMRSPEITRLYLQCQADEDLRAWPDERIWDELRLRFGEDFALAEGPVIDRSITPMRSFVAEPMQHGRLFLAGDAAHLVPPTGAKGLNVAVADARTLAEALARWYGGGGSDLLESYSDCCLRRAWRAQFFSAWLTRLFHRVPAGDSYDAHIQLAELDHLCSSAAASRAFAESYSNLNGTR